MDVARAIKVHINRVLALHYTNCLEKGAIRSTTLQDVDHIAMAVYVMSVQKYAGTEELQKTELTPKILSVELMKDTIRKEDGNTIAENGEYFHRRLCILGSKESWHNEDTE
ncbi:hypothetical protein RF11_07487 [Thelohanellus kitauei]|uniref:Uncharacterized protein n=1 Tax=Thelohanellus kitauei TaxID=669202 RepID=A0A0C2MVT8_THEKT|nr:hypothetical protein RF11_07487 [Thelohanellus kitauei]